jgi:hypothetical protein
MSKDTKPRVLKDSTGAEYPGLSGEVGSLVYNNTPEEMVRIGEGGDPVKKNSISLRVKEAKSGEGTGK